MPKHAFGRNRHLGDQLRPYQGDALSGGAAQGNSPNHPVLLADVMGVKEVPKLLCLGISRYCRRQPYAESLGARPLDSFPGACPCPLSTTAIVALRRRTVEA